MNSCECVSFGCIVVLTKVLPYFGTYTFIRFGPPLYTHIQNAKIHFTFLIVVQNSLFLRTFISRKILYGRFFRHPPSYCRIVVFYRLVYTHIICYSVFMFRIRTTWLVVYIALPTWHKREIFVPLHYYPNIHHQMSHIYT